MRAVAGARVPGGPGADADRPDLPGRQGAGEGERQPTFRKFVDAEVTPRFPDGVTVVDGGGQWSGEDNRLIREAAKVVLIVLPSKGDPAARVEAVRTAYKVRFNQDLVVVMPPPTCTAL